MHTICKLFATRQQADYAIAYDRANTVLEIITLQHALLQTRLYRICYLNISDRYALRGSKFDHIIIDEAIPLEELEKINVDLMCCIKR